MSFELPKQMEQFLAAQQTHHNLSWLLKTEGGANGDGTWFYEAGAYSLHIRYSLQIRCSLRNQPVF
jgi:hypothetical protein